MVLQDFLTGIADEVRRLTHSTKKIKGNQLKEELSKIENPIYVEYPDNSLHNLSMTKKVMQTDLPGYYAVLDEMYSKTNIYNPGQLNEGYYKIIIYNDGTGENAGQDWNTAFMRIKVGNSTGNSGLGWVKLPTIDTPTTITRSYVDLEHIKKGTYFNVKFNN